MKKSMVFKRQARLFYGEQLYLCARVTKEYFDVDDEFEVHISDRRPKENNYHTLKFTYGDADEVGWQFVDADIYDTNPSPWGWNVDHWLTDNFSKAKTLYVWMTDV